MKHLRIFIIQIVDVNFNLHGVNSRQNNKQLFNFAHEQNPHFQAARKKYVHGFPHITFNLLADSSFIPKLTLKESLPWQHRQPKKQHRSCLGINKEIECNAFCK